MLLSMIETSKTFLLQRRCKEHRTELVQMYDKDSSDEEESKDTPDAKVLQDLLELSPKKPAGVLDSEEEFSPKKKPRGSIKSILHLPDEPSSVLRNTVSLRSSESPMAGPGSPSLKSEKHRDHL